MSEISLTQFKEIELKVAKILEVDEIAGADRLWRLTVDVGGDQKKQIVAGVKNFYTREALLGKSVVLVNNLTPSVIRGVESKGMLLAAKDPTTGLTLLSLDKELPPGSVIG